MKLAFLALALSLSLTLSSVGQITAFPIPTTKISELTARTIEAGDTTVVVDSGSLGNYKVDLGDEIVALRAAIVLGSTDLELAALAALLTAHEALLTNPHAVTAAQTGAETTAQLDARDTATALLTSNHAALVNNPHSVTKAQVGLPNADNTSDANKPVSTAGASALALKADADDVATFEARVDNPHAVTKAQVGLTNADNTSDVNKPISTATQSALTSDATALSDHEALVNNPHTVTQTQVGLGNVDNTTDLLKPLSTDTIAALALKAPLASPSFAGNVGIGTTTPSVALDVVGVVAASAGMKPYTAGNGSGVISQDGAAGGLYFANEGVSSNMRFLVTNASSGNVLALTLANTTGNATFTGAVTVNGGDITLGGTGNLTVSNGNVGIGTTGSPDGLLHGLKTGTFDPVLGGSSSNSSLMFENGDGTDVGLYNGINWLKRNSAGVNGAFISAYNTDASANTGLALGTHGATAMFIDETGNVGIGTTSPSRKFNVEGNVVSAGNPLALFEDTNTDTGSRDIIEVKTSASSAAIKLTNDNEHWRILIGSQGELRLDSDSVVGVAVFQNSGNVGIGTTTPSVALDVVGAIATNDSASTLVAAATTLAVTSNFATITGAAGGNTVATITGGVAGMRVTLLFVDALVTITDTAAATANTVNLSAAFTSSANDTVELIHNGTKWFEVSRSVN
jgi:hypothetical protein